MNPSSIKASESVADRSSAPRRLAQLQGYGLAILSVGVVLGASLILEQFHFRVPWALLLLFAVAISSWYAGPGPAVLAAILSTISFYWYFVEPVHTIYIYRSQIPYFVIFTAFAALLSRFGTFRQHAEADLRRTHDQLKVERPKLGSRTIALLYFAFSSCWILFTDRLVHGLGLSNAYLLKVSEAKGILFISLSTLLMYVLVEKALRQRHSVATAYWQLVETAQEGVWSVDAEGKTVFANENMAAILGTSPGEMIGKSILPFVPQEKKDELLNHLLQREQGLQEHYEFPFLRADGAQVWTLLRVSPVLRDGQHSGCLALVSDITKGKRAEEELHESETRFRTFVDHAADALFIYDFEQGTIVEVNQQACEGLGYTRQELIGMAPRAFHLDSDRAEMESVAQRAAAGETVIDTHWHRRKDGTLFPVEVHASRYWYGGRRFLLKVARDITERKRAEEALRQSEAYLAESQRLTHTGSWAFDLASDKYVYVSEECFRIFEMDALAGLPNREAVSRLIHREDWDRVNGSFERSLREKVDTSSEFRITLPSGTVKHVQAIRHPVLNDAGDVVKLVGTVVDMTERKRAEEALRQSERELRQLIDAIPQQVFIFDPDWTPRYANRRELEYTGLTPQEVLSKDAVATIFHPEDLKKLEAIRERALLGGAPFEMEARIRGKDGNYRWFLVRDNPLRDEQGRVIRWYGTHTDIEDRKRAEETLHQVREDLAHVARVATVGEMTASIAHEINQPLAAVVTNAGAGLRWISAPSPDLEEARQALERIVKEGNRASQIIAGIRALVKKSPPQKNRLDINETIGEVILLTGSDIHKNRISLETQLSPDLPPIVGDRIQLQQVILNLIKNAIDAMSGESEGPRELVVSTGKDESKGVLVSVRDSGPGLDAASLDHLFDTFYTTKAEGLGMGLAISRTIIKAHGGKLWATPNAPRGATFQFTLPGAVSDSPKGAI